MLQQTHIGRYRLVRRLARGGMAEIFLAKQEGPGGFSKTVVIKRVLPELIENENFVRMFLDEATLAARLSHPNVVQITDFGEVDGSYFQAMEFLEGDDVGGLMRARVKAGAGPLPVPIAALIGSAVGEGLHHAHTLKGEDGKPLNVVHRDVSPNNIFVTRQGVVKVLDFGIAKAEGKIAKTRAGVVKGKAMYMSPEQTIGKNVDARSDLFALGVVLYEMLTGVRPFAKEGGDYAILSAIIDEEPKPVAEVNPAVPLALSQLIARAMMKDPAARFQTALELRKELSAFAASADQLQEFVRETLGPEKPAEASPEAAPPTDPEVDVATRVREPTTAPEVARGASLKTEPVAKVAWQSDETLIDPPTRVPDETVIKPPARAPVETVIKAPTRLPDETVMSPLLDSAGEQTVRVEKKSETPTERSLLFPLGVAALALAVVLGLVWFARVQLGGTPAVVEVIDVTPGAHPALDAGAPRGPPKI